MSAVFARAVVEVLRHEGGYVNDPNDPGGETHWGISKRSYPGLDIAALTRDEAIAIYRRDYWDRVHADELPPALALVVFDAAVNQGRYPAVLMLQEVVGARRDGVMGPETLRATGLKPLHSVLVEYLARRAMRYAFQPTLTRFGDGWFRRLFSMHQSALESM